MVEAAATTAGVQATTPLGVDSFTSAPAVEAAANAPTIQDLQVVPNLLTDAIGSPQEGRPQPATQDGVAPTPLAVDEVEPIAAPAVEEEIAVENIPDVTTETQPIESDVVSLDGTPTTPDADTAPLSLDNTSKLATTFRKAATNEFNAIQRSQVFNNADPKQKRPLNRRETVNDHYNIKTTPLQGSADQEVEVQTVGGVANGKKVGQNQTTRFRANRSQLDGTVKDVAQYAARFPNQSGLEQTTGALNVLYTNVQRYAPNAPIPGQKTVGNVLNNFNLFAQWDRLSNASRYRRTANQLVRTGRDLGYPLPTDAVNGLGVLDFGFAAYQLLDNWTAMSPEQRSIATLQTIYSGAQAYTSGSALVSGAGTSGGALVAGSAETGAAAGGSAAGTAGITWADGLSYAAAILGAYNIVTTWGEGGDAGGRTNGAANGAAVGSVFGYYGAAIGAVIGVGIGSINAGKSVEQGKRDAYRNHYEKNNVFERIDGSHNIQLADGTFYDVGQDGSKSRAVHNGQTKTVANPDRLTQDTLDAGVGNNELRPYDIDATNDLDFLTNFATTGLNLILNGGSIDEKGAAEAGQMNGYLTNAATSNVGRELTRENFTEVMSNVKGFYEKLGITTKAQGIEVINALRQADRITREELDVVLYGLEFAFSDSFETAQNLMAQLRAQDEARAQEGA